jgi:hypothetical protein
MPITEVELLLALGISTIIKETIMSSTNIYSSVPKCSCIICRKVTTYAGLVSHFENKHENKKTKYRKIPNPVTCLSCREVINDTFELHWNKCNYTPIKQCPECAKWFNSRLGGANCSQSCGGKSANKKRIADGYVVSQNHRLQISKKLKHQSTIDKELKDLEFNLQISGEYTKVKFKIRCCNNCKSEFPSWRYGTNIICDVCRANKGYSYGFKFNIYHYPDLFDLDLLNRVGWYSQGGKSRRTKNIDGLARDHKVSISEAKKNNYDPYYISHPCNCELMSQRSNSKKNTNSSITYEELVSLVDLYDGENPGI